MLFWTLCKELISSHLDFLGFAIILLVVILMIAIGSQEDFLKGGHGDTIAENVKLIKPSVKLREELLEAFSLGVVDLESDLLRDFSQLLHLTKDFLEVGLNLFVRLLVLLDHSELVASTVAVL